MAKDVQDGSNSTDNDKTVGRLPPYKKSTIRATGYLTSNTKTVFIWLKKASFEISIICHFDLKYYIRIETNGFSYAIGKILSQLTLNNKDQWYLIAYFWKKKILAKTWYKTHNN